VGSSGRILPRAIKCSLPAVARAPPRTGRSSLAFRSANACADAPAPSSSAGARARQAPIPAAASARTTAAPMIAFETMSFLPSPYTVMQLAPVAQVSQQLAQYVIELEFLHNGFLCQS
jgi:hypothetical protein